MTPKELLAVLPRISVLQSPLPGLAAEPDAETLAAVALSAENPPTPRALAGAAARTSRLLGVLAGFSLPLAAPGRRWLYLSTLWGSVPGVILSVALYPLIASAAGPADPAAAFGSVRIAVGAAGIAWFVLTSAATVSRIPYDAGTRPENHMLAVLARWLDVAGSGPRSEQLVKAEDGAAGDSGLAVHMDGDADCPCARDTCAGRAGTHAAFFFLADCALRLPLLVLSYAVLPIWTPAFSGGRVLWSTWWGCLLGASAIAIAFLMAITMLALAFISPRPPVTRLSARLQRRAVSVRLAALVRRYRVLLLAPTEPAHPVGQPAPFEPYEPLLRHLVSSWSGIRSASASGVQRISLVGLLLLPPFVANLALSCIPAWEVAVLLWWAVFVLQYLLDYAAANARIGTSEAAVRAARGEILALLAAARESGSCTDPARAERAAALSAHGDRLAAFLGAAEPARFFGFPVGYGTVRTLFVTMLTLVFAAWGLLRALGVRVVLESYCPL